jgi:hypothetical protein
MEHATKFHIKEGLFGWVSWYHLSVCHLHTSSVSVSPVSVVTLLEITDQLFITTTTTLLATFRHNTDKLFVTVIQLNIIPRFLIMRNM